MSQSSFLSRTWNRLNEPISLFSKRSEELTALEAAPAEKKEAGMRVRPSRSLLGVIHDTDNLLMSAMNMQKPSKKESMHKLYNASGVVYACVMRYMHSISPIRWEIKRRVGDNKFMPVQDHELERLFMHPNPHMAGGSLNRRLIQGLLGCGNAYQRKIRGYDGKRIQMIFPMKPQLVKPLPHGVTFLDGYRVRESETSVSYTDLKVNDVCHFQLEDPEDFYEGIGVVQANMKTIDSDTEAQNFWYNSIRRSIRKNGILSFKHDPTEDETDNLEAKIREDVLGSWNAGGILFLGQEHTWTDLAKNTQDVDFINARKMLREMIAAIFSVPPPMVGILDNSTYNNIQMARMIFWLDTLLPFLEIIRETMTRSFIVNEYEDDRRYEYIVDYDVSSVEALYYVFGQKLDLALKLFKLGVETVEIIKALGLNIDEKAVRPFGFLPGNMRTVDALTRISEAEAEQAEAAEDEEENPPGAEDFILDQDTREGQRPPGAKPNKPYEEPDSMKARSLWPRSSTE